MQYGDCLYYASGKILFDTGVASPQKCIRFVEVKM